MPVASVWTIIPHCPRKRYQATRAISQFCAIVAGNTKNRSGSRVTFSMYSQLKYGLIVIFNRSLLLNGIFEPQPHELPQLLFK